MLCQDETHLHNLIFHKQRAKPWNISFDHNYTTFLCTKVQSTTYNENVGCDVSARRKAHFLEQMPINDEWPEWAALRCFKFTPFMNAREKKRVLFCDEKAKKMEGSRPLHRNETLSGYQTQAHTHIQADLVKRTCEKERENVRSITWGKMTILSRNTFQPKFTNCWNRHDSLAFWHDWVAHRRLIFNLDVEIYSHFKSHLNMKNSSNFF